MAMMTDERNLKPENTEIPQGKLLSRKDITCLAGNTKTEQITVIRYYLWENMSTQMW